MSHKSKWSQSCAALPMILPLLLSTASQLGDRNVQHFPLYQIDKLGCLTKK